MAAKDEGGAPPSIHEVLSSPTILIKVSPEENEYRIHEPLLTFYCGFFKGALGSPAFKEAEDGAVTLDDVDVDTFENFARVLYAKFGGSGQIAPYGSITKLYVFADRILAPILKESMIDCAHEVFSSTSPGASTVAWAFDNLPSSDPFLGLLVDSQANQWNPIKDKKKRQDIIDRLPKEYLYRVLERIHEPRESGGDSFNGYVRCAKYYKEKLGAMKTD